MEYMKNLPKEIINIIFQYLQCPLATLIQHEINLYKIDYKNIYCCAIHNIRIKDQYSFSQYYFDKWKRPYTYKSGENQLYKKIIQYCQYKKKKKLYTMNTFSIIQQN